MNFYIARANTFNEPSPFRTIACSIRLSNRCPFLDVAQCFFKDFYGSGASLRDLVESQRLKGFADTAMELKFVIVISTYF